jgi:glycosyltransferase involved in cell wall biosynthesis
LVEVSAVIPCFNEEGALPELIRRVTSSLEGTGRPFEIIFIDDGSTDASFEILRKAHDEDSRVKAIRFRRNFGKSAALAAGFGAALGKYVLTLDADLQDDPDEIPRFLEKLDAGGDLVTGWKKQRNDPLEKKVPSRFFNRVTSFLTGIPIHDFNCGFKAYRREVLDEIEVYGDLHRFIPVLAHQKGFRIDEIPVQHNPRRFGKSKYGIERYLRGATDLITILFLTKFSGRPGHLFGGTGIVLSGAGFLICLYMSFLWIMGVRPIGNRPLLLLGVLLLITGVQFVSIGLLGEMLTKNRTQRSLDSSVKERLE